ncbi:gamma-glutamylcyclotransferase [Terrihabitans sp. B22-R8]|uniref:gamma-glutamylcyclotransferase n=1 Tax=Terrihabitans sp. B22-R8 TaxID=3425128 RepID=UPI00403C48A1
MDTSSDLWVFGYGSLMWRPGFVFDEARPAVLSGYHRALCIYSQHWRGTPEAPGLVLGLDAGDTCHGVAFRVARERVDETLAYLHERELRNRVYHETRQKVTFCESGDTAEALAYVADATHVQYAGALLPEERLAMITRSHGTAGSNLDYVLNTVAHLRQLGVHDEELEWMAERLVAAAA